MDARPAKDFAESRIKHSCCINIPHEILKPGITAISLESMLPQESLSHWYRRSEADHVVLIDWDSRDANTQSMQLKALKDAMSKWDQNCQLKKPPLILQGGYKDWMLKYPMYTTQVLNFDSKNENKASLILDVSAVEYPNLDENSVEKPATLTRKENLTEPGILFKKSSVSVPVVNGFLVDAVDGRKTKSAPLVDRRSKPNVIRSLKSSGVERKIGDSNASKVPNSSKSTTPVIEDKKSPTISKSRPPSIGSVGKKNIDTNKENDALLLNSFNEEENLAKENLELTKQQLLKEEEFKSLCKQKELVSEENIRKEMQKQEAILLERLKQMEIQSLEKDKAYQKVKEENIKMRKMLEEQMDKEFKKQKEKAISEAENQRKNLQEQVEKLRELRKKKEEMLAKNKAEFPKTDGVPREAVSANSALKRTAGQNQGS
ncbi:Ubiquitin carboxyl-terminal hydrolase 8, partial [Stegodyphus mimosarum]